MPGTGATWSSLTGGTHRPRPAPACKTVKTKLSLAERSFRCERCGLVLDRDLNAARNLASLIEAVGTASGAGTGQGDLANGRGEERSMGSPRCSSTNRQDGTSRSRPDRTVTATRQRVAPKPVLVQSDR
ncbi:MAG: zinc ribbon domain-containing protein [Acidimicrobiales bacterium]